MMKHYGFTANECIGWLRVARPGSVIGPQQVCAGAYIIARIRACARTRSNLKVL